MKKITNILFVPLLFILLTYSSVFAYNGRVHSASEGLIGGSVDALDAISVSNSDGRGHTLATGDIAIATDPTTDIVHIYTYDDTSSATEVVPDIIVPDDRAGGTGIWALSSFRGARPICASGRIENLSALDDDFEIGLFNYAVTITKIGLHCAGTCTTPAEILLEDRSGNAMTHTTPTASEGTSNTTYQDVASANSLVAGEALRMDVTNAVDPETDKYTISYCYTID